MRCWMLTTAVSLLLISIGDAYAQSGRLRPIPAGGTRQSSAPGERSAIRKPKFSAPPRPVKPAQTQDLDAETEEISAENEVARLTRALKADPRHVYAYCDRGKAYATLGKLDEAVADYTLAIQLKPDLMEPYGNRGLAYMALEKYAYAAADFSVVIRLRPEMARPYVDRGEAYRLAGEIKKAVADFARAVKLDPRMGEAFGRQGLAHLHEGDYAEALEQLNRASQLSPGDGEVLYDRGLAHMGRGQFDQALLDFSEVLNPAESKLQNNYNALANKPRLFLPSLLFKRESPLNQMSPKPENAPVATSPIEPTPVPQKPQRLQVNRRPEPSPNPRPQPPAAIVQQPVVVQQPVKEEPLPEVEQTPAKVVPTPAEVVQTPAPSPLPRVVKEEQRRPQRITFPFRRTGEEPQLVIRENRSQQPRSSQPGLMVNPNVASPADSCQPRATARATDGRQAHKPCAPADGESASHHKPGDRGGRQAADSGEANRSG